MIFNKKRIIKQLTEENIELKNQIEDLIKKNDALKFEQNILKVGNEVNERFIKKYEKAIKDYEKAIQELERQKDFYYKELVGLNDK